MLRGRAGCGLRADRLSLNRLVLSELTVDLQLDLLADEQATATEGNVPVEPPVGAGDGPGQRAADLDVAVRVNDRAAVFVIERDLASDAFDLQVTGDVEMVAGWRDRLQREHDLRVLLDVEEVGALEVPVAHLVVGRDARGLDGDGPAAGGRIVRIVQLEVGLHLSEAATNGCDTEMLRAEADCGVMRIKTPRHGVYSLNAGSAPGGSGAHFVP